MFIVPWNQECKETDNTDFVQSSLKSHPVLVTLNMHLHFNSGFCSEINIFFSRRPLYKCFLIIPTLYFMFRLKGCNGNVNMDRGSGSVSDSQVPYRYFILHSTMLKCNNIWVQYNIIKQLIVNLCIQLTSTKLCIQLTSTKLYTIQYIILFRKDFLNQITMKASLPTY